MRMHELSLYTLRKNVRKSRQPRAHKKLTKQVHGEPCTPLFAYYSKIMAHVQAWTRYYPWPFQLHKRREVLLSLYSALVA